MIRDLLSKVDSNMLSQELSFLPISAFAYDLRNKQFIQHYNVQRLLLHDYVHLKSYLNWIIKKAYFSKNVCFATFVSNFGNNYLKAGF